ncbi:RHS repeat-associated core domain-containing protein, partial [Burkholderia diffusa]
LSKHSQAHYEERREAGPHWNRAERVKRNRALQCGFTLYGWDGDTLAWESKIADEDGFGARTTHYVYDPDSFVPVAQAVREEAIELLDQPEYGDYYRQDEDPLWLPPPPAPTINSLAWYQCDHLGTPQELTDEHSEIAWSAEYRAWGVAQEAIRKASGKAPIANPIRFQGQYHDHETGLHYNRHRYYDPNTGRFVSKDPIGLAGGLNSYQYAPNPVQWTDPLGLSNTFPSNPDDMTKVLGVDPKIGTTPDGTPRYIWLPNSNTRIRYESHPEGLCPCDKGFNPRHHGAHYHVETKPDGLSWGQAGRHGQTTKSLPDGYTRGSGTGFNPGENFPGS